MYIYIYYIIYCMYIYISYLFICLYIYIYIYIYEIVCNSVVNWIIYTSRYLAKYRWRSTKVTHDRFCWRCMLFFKCVPKLTFKNQIQICYFRHFFNWYLFIEQVFEFIYKIIPIIPFYYFFFLKNLWRRKYMKLLTSRSM